MKTGTSRVREEPHINPMNGFSSIDNEGFDQLYVCSMSLVHVSCYSNFSLNTGHVSSNFWTQDSLIQFHRLIITSFLCRYFLSPHMYLLLYWLLLCGDQSDNTGVWKLWLLHPHSGRVSLVVKLRFFKKSSISYRYTFVYTCPKEKLKPMHTHTFLHLQWCPLQPLLNFPRITLHSIFGRLDGL